MSTRVWLVLTVCALGTGGAVSRADDSGHSPEKAPLVAGDEYKGVVIEKDRPAASKMAAVLPATLQVDTTQVFRDFPNDLLGFNQNWQWAETGMFDPKTHKLSEQFFEVLKGLPIPLTRMAGAESQRYRWKAMLGDPEKREPYNVFDWESPVQYLGPLEWAAAMRRLAPNADLTWSLNMLEDDAQDHADLAALFRAGPDDPWGKKRIEFGLVKPVNIAIWELGNEMDWRAHAIPLDEYIRRSRAAIKAIKAIDPNAKFAAQAATAPWHPKYRSQPGGWRAWHRAVLKELGDQIDYITVHPYYRGLAPSTIAPYLDGIRDDIAACDKGSGRIKVYISEHGRWPPDPDDPKLGKFALKDQTHSLSGCLAVAEYINRLAYRKEVVAAACHVLRGGPWKVYDIDEETGVYYSTGMKPLFQLLNRALADTKVLESNLTGEYTDFDSPNQKFTVTPTLTFDGQLHILAVNRDPNIARELTLDIPGEFRLRETQTLTSDSIEDYNTGKVEPLVISIAEHSLQFPAKFLNVPAKSIVLYVMEPL